MSREEYLEYIRHLPYDCMGDMSFYRHMNVLFSILLIAMTNRASTQMETRESPAVLTICRRLPMESLLAASPEQRTILQQMTMMIFYLKKGTGDNTWKQHRQF